MSERPKLVSELAKSRLGRVKSMGVSGMAASTIGFVFLGCISLGYFGGAWLDRRFGTTGWTPGLTVAGMLAGFVETFRTLRQISRSTKWPGATAKDEAESTVKFDRTAEKIMPKQRIESAPPEVRQRLFNVPPPPLPEYQGQQTAQTKLTDEEIAAQLRGDDTIQNR